MTKMTTTKQIAAKLDKQTETGDVTMLVSMMGVGVEYRLYHESTYYEEENTHISSFHVIEWLNSGPYDVVRRHLTHTRNVTTFVEEPTHHGDKLSYWRAWDEAVEFVKRKAADDLLVEYTY